MMTLMQYCNIGL